MRARAYLPFALASVLALGALFGRQDAAPAAEEEPLVAQMKLIEEGMKALRRSVRAPERRAESLEWAVKLQAAAQACKVLPLPMAKELEGVEREALETAYRKEMIGFVAELLELELALLDGDVERARASHGRLSEMEDTGHERFVEDG